jgi:3-phosphoshikimate 1-carboxyvinyltransferase
MKTLRVSPAKKLRGVLEVPGDKSISHRAVMLGSLAYGTTRIRHFLPSADCLSTIGMFRAMGVRITVSGDRVLIRGRGLNSLKPPSKTLDAGDSGTAARITLGILAGQSFDSRLTGDRYLRLRPMKRVVSPLSFMGACLTGPENANHLPLSIKGSHLRGIRYRLPVASAQVKSAILLAGLFAAGKTTVEEPVPSRDHTERMFSSFCISYKKKGKTIVLKGPSAPFHGRNILVPGDISSAAFFIVAGLLVDGSRITLKNVGINPTRSGLLEVLRKMGARLKLTRRRCAKGGEPTADITVVSSSLKAVKVEDRKLIPRMIDEFPILAVAATQAKGKTVVKNAEDLKFKESDRILMMAMTLKQMGARIEATPDGWIIQGPTALKGGRFSCGGDHRVAMSLAIAGLIAEGSTTILDTENINTSFPGFENFLKKVVS